MASFESSFSTSPTSSRHFSSNYHAKLSQRLDRVIQENKGYQFVQQNGQRIFELCPPAMCPPPKGCEIFIGNIPKHMYEDELIPLFQKIGQIYNFRLMLDFNHRNRGYAFASYFFPEHAKEAIEEYNGYVLRNRAVLAVFRSIDNRRLFIGNIPRIKTRDDVLSFFLGLVDGLVDVIMYSSWHNPTENRGFAFLEFESHLLASVARRQLHPRNLVMWDHALYVDWADPIPDVDPVVMAQVTVIYVKNLPLFFNNDQVYTLFRNVVGPRLIKKTFKTLTYAFVHCYDRACAEIVMRKLTGFIINDKTLEVEWARPREYSAQVRLAQPLDHFCRSVPLRLRKKIMETTNTRRAWSHAALEMFQPSMSVASSSDYSE